MGRQLFFRKINEDCQAVLFDFFQSDKLVRLFFWLYFEIKDIIPDVIIRGIPGNTFGVSLPGERCIFYVTSKSDNSSFCIRFRGLPDEIEYESECSDDLSEKAITGACRRRDYPEEYRIVIHQNSEKRDLVDNEKQENYSSSDTENDPCVEHTGSEKENSLPDFSEISITTEESIEEIKQARIAQNRFYSEYNKENLKDPIKLHYLFRSDRSIPFYKQFNVDPENYRNIIISEKLFSIRVSNSLLRSGIITLRDLLNISPDILRYYIKNFGDKSLEEIIYVLNKQFPNDNIDTPINHSETEQLDINPNPDGNESVNIYNNELSVYNTERKEFHDWIEQIMKIERSTDVSADSCREFSEQINDWMFDFLALQKGINEQKRQIFIRKVINGETFESIGKDFGKTREYMRRINLEVTRTVALCAYRHPTLDSINKIRELISLLRALAEDEVFVYLNYLRRQNYALVRQILFFFFRWKQIVELEKEIKNSPKTRKKPKKEKPLKVPPIPTGRLCPWCGSEIVIYTSKKGAHPGSLIVGCSAFPKCRYRGFLTMDDVRMLVEREHTNDNSVDRRTEISEPDTD